VTDGAQKEKSGWLARRRERHAERKQLRAWRRERRKGFVNAYDASHQAESSNYKSGFYKKD
jgi:hypothetical protein